MPDYPFRTPDGDAEWIRGYANRVIVPKLDKRDGPGHRLVESPRRHGAFVFVKNERAVGNIFSEDGIVIRVNLVNADFPQHASVPV